MPIILFVKSDKTTEPKRVVFQLLFIITSEKSLTSHSIHNRLFWGQVFPANQVVLTNQIHRTKGTKCNDRHNRSDIKIL